MNAALELTKQLIARSSVTPDDAGCQQLLAERLARLGFRITFLRFGAVDNLWARFGSEAPLFVFAGHTDVVPPGPLESWRFPPFCPTEAEGKLYGRGAADMKASLAAMVTATEDFLAQRQPRGSIAFLLTSDEEGPATDGTVRVMDWLNRRGEKITWALVGEPSSSDQLGDRIRVGRRGSLTGFLQVFGKQGHVAYPERVENPIHRALPVMAHMAQTVWDRGNVFFPPTSFQWVEVKSGVGASNVVPGVLEATFNLRFNTEHTAESLKEHITALWHDIPHHLTWTLGGQPFLTAHGQLLEATRAAIYEITGQNTECSTGGGTSDGRFIAPSGAEVIELGPVNATIHQVNEHVDLEAIPKLHKIYQRILEKLL